MKRDFIARLLCSLSLLVCLEADKPERVQYGKYYYRNLKGEKVRISNSYYLYLPDKPAKDPSGKFPLVFQAYGNFWKEPLADLYGPKIKSEPYIENFNVRGMAYVSIGYRGAGSPYWYDDQNGTAVREELVLVDSEGRLTIDTKGRTEEDYTARACWMERITKSVYDTVQALEALIKNADRHGVDVHRIFFQASSAGSAEVNYLTWVYHKWHSHRFTPVGMMLQKPQFDLPVRCAMGRALKMYMDHSDDGPNLQLNKVVKKEECHYLLGNNACTVWKPEASLCNMTWNNKTMERFCNSGFDKLTFGDVFKTQQWNFNDSVGRGMEKLWYVSQNMQDHQPRPFHMFLQSFDHGYAHGSMAVFSYAELADKLGLNYSVYYMDHPGLRKPIYTSTSFASKTPVVIEKNEPPNPPVLYRETFPWRSMKKSLGYGDPTEHLNWISHVFGIESDDEVAALGRLYIKGVLIANPRGVACLAALMVIACVIGVFGGLRVSASDPACRARSRSILCHDNSSPEHLAMLEKRSLYEEISADSQPPSPLLADSDHDSRLRRDPSGEEGYCQGYCQSAELLAL